MSIVAVSILGVVSACGGSSPSSTAAPGSPTSTGTAAATAPAAGTAQGFCAVIQQQKSFLQGSAMATLLSGGTADAWKTYLDQAAAANQQLVDAAPSDIQPSVKTLQQATLALQSAMAGANYDVTKVGMSKLVGLMQTPDRQAATTALVSYVKTNCSIDLTQA